MPETTKSVFKTTIRASAHDVWEEITRTDDVIPCFFDMRMHVDAMRAGSRLRMRTRNGRYTGVVGEILEFDPPRRFAHTFRFTSLDDPPCKVIYELRELAEGVEFTLTIEDLVPGTKSAKQMTQGASFILKTLKGCVEEGRPPLGCRMLLLLIKLTTPLTPKRCRSVNWP